MEAAARLEVAATPAHLAWLTSQGRWAFPRWLQHVNNVVTDFLLTPGEGFLAIEVPVRHGKSQHLSVFTPAWYLGQFPERQVLLTTYSDSLSRGFGRRARQVLEQHGPDLFGVKIQWDARASNDWKLEAGGGMRSVSRGGTIIGTGGDLCVAEGTLVETPDGPVPIEVLSQGGGTVLACDDRGVPVWSKITGGSCSIADELLEVTFTSGRVLRCTPDHPLRVEGAPERWVEARLVESGARVPAVRGAGLRRVRGDVPPAGARRGQGTAAGSDEGLLLQGLHRQEGSGPAGRVRGLWAADHGDGPVLPALWHGTTGGGSTDARQARVRPLRGEVRPAQSPHAVLLEGLRQRQARTTDEGQGERSLRPRPGAAEVPAAFRPDAQDSSGARRELCGLQLSRRAGGAPHRLGPGAQRVGEPHTALPSLPPDASHLELDTVAMVRPVRGDRFRVHDIQVESTHCFFADQICVSNCIIDDPYKDHTETDHRPTRERIFEWYQRTLRSRLEPGGKVLLIMSRWHQDDLIGRLLDRPRYAEGDHWQRIYLPALAQPHPEERLAMARAQETEEEQIDLEAWRDPIGRAVGEPLWPERYGLPQLSSIRAEVGPVTWNAQFQQAPITPGGGMFPKHRWNAVNAAARDLDRVCRIDLAAAGKRTSDFAAMGLVGRDRKGFTYVLDVRRLQAGSSEVEEWVRKSAAELTEEYGAIHFVIEQEPGSGGLTVAENYVRDTLAPYSAEKKTTGSDKVLNATPLSGQQQAGNVFLLRRLDPIAGYVGGRWWTDFIDEGAEFPKGVHDDQIDVVAHAYNDLVIRARTNRKRRVKVTSVAKRSI